MISQGLPKDGCWICDGEANSKEHSPKKSDLNQTFPGVSQLLIHTDKRQNTPIKGLNANLLKSNGKICSTCNNDRTSAHDREWQKLSAFIHQIPIIQKGDFIPLGKVFPSDVNGSMLNVHLFFVKQFGCAVKEHNIPIDLRPFSEAILKNIPHPYVYLEFCENPYSAPNHSAGRSDLITEIVNGKIMANWFYFIGSFLVNVRYAETEQRLRGWNAWHPETVNEILKIGAVE